MVAKTQKKQTRGSRAVKKAVVAKVVKVAKVAKVASAPAKTVRQHRYPWHVIEAAVRMYRQEGLTFRAIAKRMGSLGVEVSHKTIFEWVNKFEDDVSTAQPLRKAPRSFDVVESHVKCNGEWRYLYRALDERNGTLAVCLRKSKNPTAAKNFFQKEFKTLSAV